MTQIFFRTFWKLMQSRKYYYYGVCWILTISDKQLWSYQGDKILIWWKKDWRWSPWPGYFPELSENWCSLGNTTTMQYDEYWVYRISGFEVIRVTRYQALQIFFVFCKKVQYHLHKTKWIQFFPFISMPMLRFLGSTASSFINNGNRLGDKVSPCIPQHHIVTYIS